MLARATCGFMFVSRVLRATIADEERHASTYFVKLGHGRPRFCRNGTCHGFGIGFILRFGFRFDFGFDFGFGFRFGFGFGYEPWEHHERPQGGGVCTMFYRAQVAV